MPSKAESPRIPFVSSERDRDFQEGISKFFREALDASTREMIAPQNVMQLRHGRTWTHSSDDSEPGVMEVHTAQKEMSFEDIAKNNMTAFREFLIDMAGQFRADLHKGMYAAVEASTEKSGNVVSAAQEGSFPLAFLAMLKKIEFGVDANGQVSLPSLHVAPGQAEKMIAEMEAQGEEYRAELESVKREKIEAALAKERDRLARFKS